MNKAQYTIAFAGRLKMKTDIIPTLQVCQIQAKVISNTINITDYHAKTTSIVCNCGVKSRLAAARFFFFFPWLQNFPESVGILLNVPHLHLLTWVYKEKHIDDE